MLVIPAVDVRGGKCVRLYQGDYEQETVYSDDPALEGRRWARLGATWIHVVDLDGARSGAPANLDVVGRIVASSGARVQLGGGIRTLDDARRAIGLGVDRVIMGSAAVQSPEIVGELCREVGAEAVVVAVDVRDGYAVVDGWARATRTAAADLIARTALSGVRRFMYTDVTRDGTLTEPNLRAIEEVSAESDAHLLVAGGIASLEHLAAISRLGVEGAIVGRALYTGDIDLGSALELVDRETRQRS